jgi:hypothetical protein
MFTVSQPVNAMIVHSRLTAPDHDITVVEVHAARPVRSGRATPQEGRRQAERHGDDRRLKVPLVFVLMQGQPRPWNIAIDKTGIGNEALEPRPGRLRFIRVPPWPA